MYYQHHVKYIDNAVMNTLLRIRNSYGDSWTDAMADYAIEKGRKQPVITWRTPVEKNFHDWNGTAAGVKLDDMSNAAGLIQDDAGTVYYRNRVTGDICVWCPACDLARHVRHLNQLNAR